MQPRSFWVTTIICLSCKLNLIWTPSYLQTYRVLLASCILQSCSLGASNVPALIRAIPVYTRPFSVVCWKPTLWQGRESPDFYGVDIPISTDEKLPIWCNSACSWLDAHYRLSSRASNTPAAAHSCFARFIKGTLQVEKLRKAPLWADCTTCMPWWAMAGTLSCTRGLFKGRWFLGPSLLQMGALVQSTFSSSPGFDSWYSVI